MPLLGVLIRLAWERFSRIYAQTEDDDEDEILPIFTDDSAAAAAWG